MEDKTKLDPAVKAFFAEIGHRNGAKLFKERGSQYFRDIAAKRKTHGRQGIKGINKDGSETLQTIAKRYGVSKQRIQQIIKTHGESILEKSNFVSESTWREAVIGEYFARKTQ